MESKWALSSSAGRSADAGRLNDQHHVADVGVCVGDHVRRRNTMLLAPVGNSMSACAAQGVNIHTNSFQHTLGLWNDELPQEQLNHQDVLVKQCCITLSG